jgi:dTDP-glucose 4,6-dehydratase
MQLIVQISVELGWSPQYGFEAGLDATVKWYMVNRQWWEPLLTADAADIRRGLATKGA